MVNKIHKRHQILMFAETSLKAIENDIIKGLKDKGLNYDIKTKINHEVYEIQINYRKVEFTYHEIARKLVDQIDINEDDIRNIMEKIIFDKIKY